MFRHTKSSIALLKNFAWIFLLLVACAKVRDIDDVPEIAFGEPWSFPTIEALTDAPIIGSKYDNQSVFHSR